jgi:L-rhamnose-H+ transport protein
MESWSGLLLVVVSGVMAGSTLTPSKFMRKYQFGNYWLIHSLVGTVLVPWTLALATVPNLFEVYGRLPVSSLLLPPLFAFSWGIASTLGGLCVARIGLSLTYALVIGIGGVAGTVIPILYFSPGLFGTPAGRAILLGIAVMTGGLVLVARAGREKERTERTRAGSHGAGLAAKGLIQGSFLAGLLMASLAGVLSAGLNFSFAFASGITAAAIAEGAAPASASYAVWALAMLGGMLPNLAYALIHCTRNRAWPVFRMSAATDVPLAVLMGCLFMGSTALYGLGAIRLGVLGVSAGWGIMQIMQIVVGNLGGFWTGEWRVAGPGPTRKMLAGVATLAAASALMAYGNYLQPDR